MLARSSAVRRAKIVCTLGPATSSESQIDALVAAGMDVARLNLSHGSYADHEKAYLNVRAASDASGHGVGVLVDLQGPKIRVGTFAPGPSRCATGESSSSPPTTSRGRRRVVTTYDGLPGDVSPGDRMLIDDGKVALESSASTARRHQGRRGRRRVSDHKGINLPGVAVSVPALSEKDKEDLRWALHLRADLIALSFVRGAATPTTCARSWTRRESTCRCIAKIEKPQAVDNLDEIVEAFDGIDGRPRRPRRRAAARGRAVRAEAGGRRRPAAPPSR